MPRRSQVAARRIASLFVISLLVHLGVWQLLPRAVLDPEQPPAHLIELDMLQVVAAATSEGSASGPQAPREAAKSTRRPRPSPPTIQARAQDLPMVAAEKPQLPAADTDDLSPSAADSAGSAPSLAAAQPPADLSPRGIAVDTLAASLAAATGAELSTGLRAVASAKPFGKREPPSLRRDHDGTCHYAGTAIDATILPDGGVQFDAKPGRWDPQYGVDEPPAHPTQFEDTLAPQRLQFSMKHSAPAVESERAWFLQETQGVRRELAQQTRERELRRTDEQLRRHLESIWCDERQALPERRRAVFALWDATSPDEVGERARRLVIDYVRRHAPSGSELAFTGAELLALNADREQRAQFEPYGAQ